MVAVLSMGTNRKNREPFTSLPQAMGKSTCVCDYAQAQSKMQCPSRKLCKLLPRENFRDPLEINGLAGATARWEGRRHHRAIHSHKNAPGELGLEEEVEGSQQQILAPRPDPSHSRMQDGTRSSSAAGQMAGPVLKRNPQRDIMDGASQTFHDSWSLHHTHLFIPKQNETMPV